MLGCRFASMNRPTMSRWTEVLLAALTSAMPLAAALVFGDPLYLGPWYYASVFGAAIVLSVLLRPAPLFTLGATVALLATFAGYWAVALSRTTPDGLLGLGHLSSLPGAALGLIVGWLVVRKGSGQLAALGVGFGWAVAGFCVNQLIVCNTLMACGPLSWWR